MESYELSRKEPTVPDEPPPEGTPPPPKPPRPPAPFWPSKSDVPAGEDLPIEEFFLLQGSRIAGGMTSFESFSELSAAIEAAARSGELINSTVGNGEAEGMEALGKWRPLGGRWRPLGGRWRPLGGSYRVLGSDGEVPGGFEDGDSANDDGGGATPSPAARDAIRRSQATRAVGRGMGYHKDLPDARDWTPEQLPALLKGKLKKWHFQDRDYFWLMGVVKEKQPLPEPKGACHLGDYNPWLWPVEDQGMFQSCTANAVVGAAEYLLRRDAETRIDLSRLFLYKNTRKMLGWTGDSGAYLRETIRALRTFGAPPEQHVPYVGAFLDAEPTPFSYQLAQEFSNTAHLRLDDKDGNGNNTLTKVKAALADGFPVVLGFTVHRSIALMGSDYVIPDPSRYDFDESAGGHAVLCVGFDDDVEVTAFERDKKTGKRGDLKPDATRKGALIIRNSWGVGWGNLGFAYLPYTYVRENLASDFWALLSGTREGGYEQRKAWRIASGAPTDSVRSHGKKARPRSGAQRVK